MAAVWLRFRSELRGGWRGLLAIALLLGLVGGVAIAAAAGARRNATAWDRLLAQSDSFDVLVNPDLGVQTELDPTDVESLPGVERLSRVAGMLAFPLTDDGEPDAFSSALSLAAADEHVFVDVDLLKMETGRAPDPSAEHEVLVSPEFADESGLRVGDRLSLWVSDPAGFFGWVEAGSAGQPPGEAQAFTIVGTGEMPDNLVGDETFEVDWIILSYAFYRQHEDKVLFPAYLAHLEAGDAGVPEFRDAVNGLVPDEPVEFQTMAVTADKVERSVRPQTVALTAFAALVGVAALVVAGQAMSRRLLMDADDVLALHALGMTHAQRAAVATMRTVAVGLAAACIAVVTAVALSPLFPIGTAGRLEPAPGVELNLAVLAAGAVVCVLGLVLWTLLPTQRLARPSFHGPTQRVAERPNRLVMALAGTGARPSLVTGVRLALERGRGRTAVPVRSTLIGVALALATVVAAFTFGAGLRKFVDTPRLYGWTWDAMVNLDSEETFDPRVLEPFRTSPDVAGLSVGLNDRVVLDGRPVPAVGIRQVEGAVAPTVVSGRLPSGPDEVALGSRTLDRLGVDVGDTVVLGSGASRRTVGVVGKAVFPGLGTYQGSDRTELGVGALLPLESLEESGAGFNFYFIAIDYRDGVDAAAATTDLLPPMPGEALGDTFTMPARPSDVINLERIEGTPFALAAVLAVLAAGSLTHVLVSAVRRRRRDFAVLRSIGFVGRQVSVAVAWQATTVVLIGLLVGAPLGVAAGRWTWSLLAEQLGAPVEPVTPVWPVVLVGLGAILLANVVATLPARSAARTRPAIVLRAE